MAEITAADVAKLRRMTNAGMMECKKALAESNGDFDVAVDILRKKGEATAAKKADRDANEGIIAQYIAPGAKAGVLLEVNCETDFVAKNEDFQNFCSEVAKTLAENPSADTEGLRTAAVAKIGENIQFARHARLEIEGSGMVAAYIHTGGKVGVLVQVSAGKDASTESDSFKQLVRDITLQIAAASPVSVDRTGVDTSILEKEKEIMAEQFKDKPAAAIEKILSGKMEKFYQTSCLVDQGFVKSNGETTVGEEIAKVAKELGDEISVKGFLRYQVGEAL